MQLVTKQLYIRPARFADASALFSYRSDKITNKYQGFIPNTENEILEFIKQLPKEINIPGTWFQLVILLKDEERVIGDIGIHFMKEDETVVELGCTLSKEYHGNGYSTEALTVVRDYLFNELNKSKLIGSVDPRNKPSIKMLQSIGMKEVAFNEKAFELRGEWVDEIVFSLSYNDYLFGFPSK